MKKIPFLLIAFLVLFSANVKKVKAEPKQREQSKIANSGSANISGGVFEYKIVIKEHKFIPQNFEIPSEQKVKLIIDNQDDSVEEFESFDLQREKIVKGGKSVVVFIGPLKPGTYKYFGDFHSKTAQGIITAK